AAVVVGGHTGGGRAEVGVENDVVGRRGRRRLDGGRVGAQVAEDARGQGRERVAEAGAEAGGHERVGELGGGHHEQVGVGGGGDGGVEDVQGGGDVGVVAVEHLHVNVAFVPGGGHEQVGIAAVLLKDFVTGEPVVHVGGPPGVVGQAAGVVVHGGVGLDVEGEAAAEHVGRIVEAEVVVGEEPQALRDGVAELERDVELGDAGAD